MKFTAIVQHFYQERRKYLASVCNSIIKADPGELIVWNNSGCELLPDPGEPPNYHAPLKSVSRGLTVVDSTRNTLLGRYAAAFIAETDFIYVQDDDLIVESDTIQRLVSAAADHPNKIVGISGCVLERSESAYTKARWVSEGPCDVTLGRCWAAHRGALAPGFARILKDNMKPGRADDIFMSMAGHGGWVIPGKFTNLDEEGVGLSHEPEHFAERNAMARLMIGR